jgi:hypothetical protein
MSFSRYPDHIRLVHPNAEPVPEFIRPYPGMPTPPRPTERRVEQGSTKPRKTKNVDTEGQQRPTKGRESPGRAAHSIEYNLEGPTVRAVSSSARELELMGGLQPARGRAVSSSTRELEPMGGRQHSGQRRRVVPTSTITSGVMDREVSWLPEASRERPARAAQFEDRPERARKRGADTEPARSAAKVRRLVSPPARAPAGRAVLCSPRSLKVLEDYAHYRALCKFFDDRRGQT